MATYEELHDIAENSALMGKVVVAVAVAADTIRLESPATSNHANRLIWAKEALEDPRSKAVDMLWGLLANNKAAAVGAITGAADATIQTAVDAFVDVFAGAA